MLVDVVAETILPAAVRSVPAARRLVRDALAAHDLDDVCDQVELAVSELVTNAVVHAGTEVTLKMAVAGEAVRVEVGDGSEHVPALRHYASTSRTGRGLQMLQGSVDRWGVDTTPHGKTVWFEVGTVPPGEADVPVPSPRGASRRSVVQVRLRDVPVLMHWAWQEHAQALLREYLLCKLEEDPAVLDQHAQASEALAVLYEQVPQPVLPEDPDALLAETLEPDVTVAELGVEVPVSSIPHFETLNQVLARATEAAAKGLFLGPPTQPEIQEMRTWLCDEVARQAAGETEPVAWRTRTETRTLVGDPAHLLAAYSEMTGAGEHVLVTTEASVIVAASDSITRFLGYDAADDLVGRRTLVVIPSRYHQAHIAGTTLNATNGRDALLDVHLTVPLVRADGSEATVGLRVTPHTLHGTRVFVADIDLPEGEGSPAPVAD